ncbi:MAG TPA: DUF488 domain-containing protein [Candidatus Binatia bacterium]|nr:DUF488 domain-containing protein [Candidatus Binatia bacterium]
MLKSKGLYLPPSPEDGIRICVLSRLTENDGKTPVPALVRGELFDEWLPRLAPPAKTVGAWYRKEINWVEFARQYLHYLRTPLAAQEVKYVARRALEADLTLLCVEETSTFCHRSILVNECKYREHNLEIRIE